MNFFDSFRESLVCRAAAFFIGWLGVVSVGAAPMPADLVLLDAHIYTATGQGDAEALATRHGQLVYVGDTAGARSLIGKKTTVVHAQGRRILPGLVDAHIHPLDIVDLDVCDLDSAVKTLKELSGFVKDCVEHYHLKPGQWLLVHQWAYSSGGQPSAGYSTVRAALDKATSVNPVQLLGNDGHHAGFNSVALAAAKSQTGQVVGLTKATLASEFKAYTKLIGVDASGEPDGTVNEDARYFVNPHNMLYNDLAATAKVPERIPQRLNSVGITAMLDAMAAFVQLLGERIQPGGRLRLATDWAPYAHWMLDVLSTSNCFDNAALDQGFVKRPAERPVTKFERRGLRLGHVAHDLEFIRKVVSIT